MHGTGRLQFVYRLVDRRPRSFHCGHCVVLPRCGTSTGIGSGRVADDFVSGRVLSSAFYAEVVGPLLGHRRHSAGLLGSGSDVLGFDTAVFTDHGWGPRMHVFVAASEVDGVRRVLDAGLPEQFRGWPVRFGWDGGPDQHAHRLAAPTGRAGRSRSSFGRAGR
jgi:hypothetical protein